MSQPKVERIGIKTFKTYEDAKSFQANQLVGFAKKFDKSKIFARWNGVYDLVWYKNIEVAVKK